MLRLHFTLRQYVGEAIVCPLPPPNLDDGAVNFCSLVNFLLQLFSGTNNICIVVKIHVRMYFSHTF